MPGHRAVRVGRAGAGGELALHVVVAARRGQDDRRLPADGAGQRVVGGGVAGVQREHQHRRGCPPNGSASADGADPEGQPVQPGLGGQPGVALDDVRADVDADGLHLAQPLGQEAVRGEGEVGVAAAQVDDPDAGGRRAAASRVGSSSRRNASTWRRLSPSAPSTRNSGSSGDEQPLADPVVRAHLDDPAAGRRAVHLGGALLGDPQLHGLVDGLDVPVAERLGQQRVDRGRRRRRTGCCGSWRCGRRG